MNDFLVRCGRHTAISSPMPAGVPMGDQRLGIGGSQVEVMPSRLDPGLIGRGNQHERRHDGGAPIEGASLWILAKSGAEIDQRPAVT
jgi:hypothetical protein